MTDYNDKIQKLSLMELMMEWKHINELIKEHDATLKVLTDKEKLIEENITLRDNSYKNAAEKTYYWHLNNAVEVLDDTGMPFIKIGYDYPFKPDLSCDVIMPKLTYQLIRESPNRFALSPLGIIDLTYELKPMHCFINGEPTKEICISAEAIKDNLYMENFPKQANPFGENIEEDGTSEEEIKASKTKIWNDHQKAMAKSKKMTQKSILKNLRNKIVIVDDLYPKEYINSSMQFEVDKEDNGKVAAGTIDQTGREIDLDTEIRYVCFIDDNIQNSKIITLLAKNDIFYLDQLVRLDEPSLLRWRRMGPNTVGLINAFLQDNRLKLGMTEQEIDTWKN